MLQFREVRSRTGIRSSGLGSTTVNRGTVVSRSTVSRSDAQRWRRQRQQQNHPTHVMYASRARQQVLATLVGPERHTSKNDPEERGRLSATSGPASLPLLSSTSPAEPFLLLPDSVSKRSGFEVEEDAMWGCIDWHKRHPGGADLGPMRWSGPVLEQAYERCGTVTSEYAKTFYLGTQLMTPEQAKAIWAIYVWCRRTDELVDGPNASRITPKALDRWEERLESLFEGRPYDVLDAALTDTISKFPVHIQPFRDMVDGMRMDLVQSRYETYDDLYGYCYRVAGTVALMSVPVMGIDASYKGPMEKVYRAALSLGIANQMTNILRDVGEDCFERNRIYVPLEDLDRFGIKEHEVQSGLLTKGSVVDERWKAFMKFQIARTRDLFKEAEAGVDLLDQKARWPVWSALILYRQILNAIEANKYDNFSKRAYVPKFAKLFSLPMAYSKAIFPSKLSTKLVRQPA